jgi:hypothetical protein
MTGLRIVRSESHCALRLRYADLVVSIKSSVDITCNKFYNCTATFRTQICKKCLQIKLNRFRPVHALVNKTSDNFYTLSDFPNALYMRPSNHCARGWVIPSADPDGCGKSRPHRDSIPGPSSP